MPFCLSVCLLDGWMDGWRGCHFSAIRGVLLSFSCLLCSGGVDGRRTGYNLIPITLVGTAFQIFILR